MLSGFALQAQTIVGTVTDAYTGEPLTGASIMKLNGEGTITDEKGKFILEKISEKEVLTISFIGYQTKVTDTIHNSIGAIVSHSDGGETKLRINFKLIPVQSNLSEVVVSAGRYAQRLEEVTVSLDVIKPNLQQDKNQVKLENTLQQAPGVNITDGSANIRGGSGWSYGTGTRVQTLVDGLPLISGDAGQAQWDLIPVHSINRMEILKGASSVLYGSAAMNGIINIITHPYPEKQALTVNLYSGLYDAPTRQSLKWWPGTRLNSGFNFDYRQPLTPQTGLVLGGGQILDQGFRYLDNEQRTRLFAKYLYRSKKIKGLEASFATHVTYADNGDVLLWENDSLGYIPADSAITRSTGWDFFIDPTIKYRKGKFLHTLQGRYLRLNNNSKSTEADYTNTSDQVLGQYLLQFFYNTKLALTAGISTTQTQSTSVVFVGKHTSANNAVFFQGDYKPRPWLNLNAGLRYENYHLDDRFTEKPVFRGGLNVQIIKGTNARFSYGEAFRFPAISEAYTSTSFGSLTVYPNPGLKPETGHSLELGLRQMLYSKKVKGYIDVAAFQMRYYDMIEFTFAQWGPPVLPTLGLGFKPLNVRETLIRGIEVSTIIEGEWSQKLKYRLIAGYTYINPRPVEPDSAFAIDPNGFPLTYKLTSSDTTDIVLKYRYQHLFKFDFQISYSKWAGGASLRYNDFMQNIDRLFNDAIEGVAANRERNFNGDVVVDARLGYKISDHWQTDVLVNNIFNREVMLRPGFLDAPRTYSLRISYTL